MTRATHRIRLAALAVLLIGGGAAAGGHGLERARALPRERLTARQVKIVYRRSSERARRSLAAELAPARLPDVDAVIGGRRLDIGEGEIPV